MDALCRASTSLSDPDEGEPPMSYKTRRDKRAIRKNQKKKTGAKLAVADLLRVHRARRER
jgi:hypothetical protein